MGGSLAAEGRHNGTSTMHLYMCGRVWGVGEDCLKILKALLHYALFDSRFLFFSRSSRAFLAF